MGAAAHLPRASVFAPPRLVTRLEDCVFYHTQDVPGYGTVPGPWDLRGHVDEYLGGVTLRGKRVLELGTASGFLCVEMEKRGAEVVAFDLSEDYDCDVVPFGRRLVELFPDRVLWGTDWPHPNMKKEAPDDGILVDYIPKVAPSAAEQKALLIDNPMRLYWT